MFLTIKQCTYAKLNCLKYNFICIKLDLALNKQQINKVKWNIIKKAKP